MTARYQDRWTAALNPKPIHVLSLGTGVTRRVRGSLGHITKHSSTQLPSPSLYSFIQLKPRHFVLHTESWSFCPSASRHLWYRCDNTGITLVHLIRFSHLQEPWNPAQWMSTWTLTSVVVPMKKSSKPRTWQSYGPVSQTYRPGAEADIMGHALGASTSQHEQYGRWHSGSRPCK